MTPPKTIRVFGGIGLPEQAQLRVATLQKTHECEYPQLRWTRPDQYHLTLSFLGEIPEIAVQPLIEKLGEIEANHRRFTLKLQGLGAFPNLSRATVLWVGLVGDSLKTLQELKASFDRVATLNGTPPTDNRFHPHLTLARSRDRRVGSKRSGLDLRGLAEGYREWSPGILPVEELVLYASELSKQGPRYRSLHRCQLQSSS